MLAFLDITKNFKYFFLVISALLSYSNYLKLKEPLGAHKRFCLEAMEYTHVLFIDICVIALRILKAIFMSMFGFV